MDFIEEIEIFKKLIKQCEPYKNEDFFVILNNKYMFSNSNERKDIIINLLRNKTLEKIIRKKKLCHITTVSD